MAEPDQERVGSSGQSGQSSIGITVHDAERIEADDALMERAINGAFYEFNRALAPGFTAMWANVTEEEKAPLRKAVVGVLRAITTTYKTPGCGCDYCAGDERIGHGKPLMCRQRWLALPSRVRSEIADSMDG